MISTDGMIMRLLPGPGCCIHPLKLEIKKRLTILIPMHFFLLFNSQHLDYSISVIVYIFVEDVWEKPNDDSF